MDNPQTVESTLLVTEIENIFDEWVPCDAENHLPSAYHGGPESGGEWYVTKNCPSCHHGSTLLICNEYADLIREYMRDGATVKCMVCGRSGDIHDFFKEPVSRKG